MQARHEEPSLARMELLGHLAAAARLALLEAPSADGVILTVEARPEGFTVDCTLTVGQVPTSGWGV